MSSPSSRSPSLVQNQFEYQYASSYRGVDQLEYHYSKSSYIPYVSFYQGVRRWFWTNSNTNMPPLIEEWTNSNITIQNLCTSIRLLLSRSPLLVLGQFEYQYVSCLQGVRCRLCTNSNINMYVLLRNEFLIVH